MKYFLYRHLELLSDVIPLEFVAGDAINAQNGDLFIVYVPVTHEIVGVFELQNMELHSQKKTSKLITMKDVLKKLSFITHVNDSTMRVFKKRFREISKEDFDAIVHSF